MPWCRSPREKLQIFDNKRETLLSMSPYSLKWSLKDKMDRASMPQALPVQVSVTFLCKGSPTHVLKYFQPGQGDIMASAPSWATAEPHVQCPLNPWLPLFLSLFNRPCVQLIFSAGHLSGAGSRPGSCGLCQEVGGRGPYTLRWQLSSLLCEYQPPEGWHYPFNVSALPGTPSPR